MKFFDKHSRAWAKAIAIAVVLVPIGAAFWFFTQETAEQEIAGIPAIVYDIGGKHDGTFNAAAFKGAESFKAKTGVDYVEFDIERDAQREQAIRNFARRGYKPVIAIGFSNANAMKKVAAEFPDTEFAIIDGDVDMPNVRAIKFREHEGSYLVGVIAAMTTDTDKIGFVGGMDIPLISKFACGYAQGAKAINPAIEVYENMTGTTPDAWNDPVKGGELAKSQFDRGADVVFAAAGNTGNGVLLAAAKAGKYGIGVDSNQNHLHPGSVLTSMIKRVDVGVEEAMTDSLNGEFTSGTRILGLKEEGVGYALDEHNRALITPTIMDVVEQKSADIIAGEIPVHDYTTNNSCPI